MIRSDAKRIAERNGIKLGKWKFASINKSKNVWFIDIPISDVAEQYIILLHDPRKGTEYLHVLDIPAGFLLQNQEKLVVRNSPSGRKISLELSINMHNKFQDRRPTGRNVSFARFVRNEGIQ